MQTPMEVHVPVVSPYIFTWRSILGTLNNKRKPRIHLDSASIIRALYNWRNWSGPYDPERAMKDIDKACIYTTIFWNLMYRDGDTKESSYLAVLTRVYEMKNDEPIFNDGLREKYNRAEFLFQFYYSSNYFILSFYVSLTWKMKIKPKQYIWFFEYSLYLLFAPLVLVD